MIIVRTPYRISFFGGGTDLPAWFNQHGGEVLSTTINHYSWITCRYLPPFFDHKHRLVWSKLERTMGLDDMEHPAVKAALQDMGFGTKGLDITVLSDLPARAGLGSSSTFAVGLLNGLHRLRGTTLTKREMADGAIRLERQLLAETGGIQDQIAAAYGGMNHITIERDGDYRVAPVLMPVERQRELQEHCMLFFSGISRSAYMVEDEKIKGISSGDRAKTGSLHDMAKLVAPAKAVLMGQGNIEDFGQMLHDTWVLKRGLASGVSTDVIDDMYARAQAAGALGGKLLGAGGGGFFLVFASPDKQDAIKAALNDMIYVPFQLDGEGSQIVLTDDKDYPAEVYARQDFIHLQKRVG